MGEPKLLLPWPSESLPNGKIIDQVLQAWTTSEVVDTVVVVRRDDDLLRTACERWPVSIVQPDDSPVDMKASVQIALRHLETVRQPTEHHRCFVAPADLPTLDRRIINRMIASPTDQKTIAVATYGGRTSHPVLFPWPITSKIFQLGADEGINAIVNRYDNVPVEFPAQQAVNDIDTPEDYQRVLKGEQPP